MAHAQDFPEKPASLKILDELCRNEFGTLYSCQLDGAQLIVRRVKRETWEPVLRCPKQGNADEQEGEKSKGLPKFKTLWAKFQGKPHPNILGLKEAYVDRPSKDLLLVSESGGQTLESFVSRNISDHRRKELCQGIARGLQYLHHTAGQYHGCLNLDDMFLSDEGLVRIGGLDLMCLFNANPEVALSKLVDSSYPYMALERGSAVTAQLDVFALGVVVLEVLLGHRCKRLGQGEPRDASAKSKSVEVDRRKDFIDGLAQDHPFKSVVLGCLQDKANKRPDLPNIYGAIIRFTENLDKLDMFDLDFLKPEEIRVLMVGIDGAGKTTILYQLKLGEKVVTIPTIGFNVETIPLDDLNMVVWDVGGSDRIRPLWRHYFQDTNGLIFVFDSSDHERMEEAKGELKRILEQYHNELKNCPIMILANKQDLPSAKMPQEIEQEISDLFDGQEQRLCGVFGVVGLEREGLWDAIQHLKDVVVANNK